MGNSKEASRCFSSAKNHIATPEHHSVILIEYYRHGNILPFRIPFTAIFKISQSKLKNLEKKEFLKNAKVVVDSDPVQ